MTEKTFERCEIHIAEALAMSDDLGKLIKTPGSNDLASIQAELDRLYGDGSIFLALRALAGAYRRVARGQDAIQ